MIRIHHLLALTGFALALAGPAQALEGNVDAGKKVFAKCAVCHGIGETKKPVGPTLNNVIGRPAASDPDFLAKGAGGYSKALLAAAKGGLIWDEANFLEWITAPQKKVPGAKMAFPGLPKEQDRVDVLAYVKTFTK